MFRRTTMTIVALAALTALIVAPALARQAVQTTNPTRRMAGASARPADPSGVYGYVVTLNPRNGQRWLPDQYPELTLHFRQVGGTRTATAFFGAGAGTAPDQERQAWRYGIHFEHVNQVGREPSVAGNYTVVYNPREWSYSHMAVRMRHFSQPGRLAWELEFAPRAHPFPDLPDNFTPAH